MSFCDLLVHVDTGESAPERVRFAFDLARRMQCRLTGMHVTPPADLPPLYKPSQIAETQARLASRLALGAEAAALTFDAEANSQLDDTAWITADGDIAQAISTAARYVDLVIIGQYDWQDPAEAHPLPVAHAVAMRCGRPVLVVPDHVQTASFARVIIAWDGSREAVRAIHDSMPLLQLAGSATILTVHGGRLASGVLESPKLIAHLGRHGVAATLDEQYASAGDEHDDLRRHLELGDFDLVIMGAYSHSKWAELVFGGATKSILLTSSIPVLVSH